MQDDLIWILYEIKITEIYYVILTDNFSFPKFLLNCNLLYVVILRSLLHSKELFSFILQVATSQSTSATIEFSCVSIVLLIPSVQYIPSCASTVLVQFKETISPFCFTTSAGSRLRGLSSSGHVLTTSVDDRNRYVLTGRRLCCTLVALIINVCHLYCELCEIQILHHSIQTPEQQTVC